MLTRRTKRNAKVPGVTLQLPNDRSQFDRFRPRTQNDQGARGRVCMMNCGSIRVTPRGVHPFTATPCMVDETILRSTGNLDGSQPANYISPRTACWARLPIAPSSSPAFFSRRMISAISSGPLPSGMTAPQCNSSMILALAPWPWTGRAALPRSNEKAWRKWSHLCTGKPGRGRLPGVPVGATGGSRRGGMTPSACTWPRTPACSTKSSKGWRSPSSHRGAVARCGHAE